MRCLFYLMLITFSITSVAAQPQYCDEILQRGDTTICQNFSGKKHFLDREDFYVQDVRIFTRWWYYHKDGSYGWQQKQKKSAFAKAEGPAAMYYASGQLMAVSIFSHGKQMGHYGYHPSGSIAVRCHHNQQGEKHGMQTIYYENGQVASKIRWENGRLREILEYKDEQGNDLPVGSFQQGNGDWIAYENGQPTYIYPYRNGREGKRKKINTPDGPK